MCSAAQTNMCAAQIVDRHMCTAFDSVNKDTLYIEAMGVCFAVTLLTPSPTAYHIGRNA